MAEGDGYILVPGSKQDDDESKNVKARYVGGAGLVSSAPRDSGPIYEDEDYRYFGETSTIGAALTDSDWLVSRVHRSTGQEQYVTANEDQVYTDLATVQGLFA
jgi:hypothetical protein